MPACGHAFYLPVFNSISHLYAEREWVTYWVKHSKIKFDMLTCNIFYLVRNWNVCILEGMPSIKKISCIHRFLQKMDIQLQDTLLTKRLNITENPYSSFETQDKYDTMWLQTWNILGISLASARMTSPCVTDLTWNNLLQGKICGISPN